MQIIVEIHSYSFPAWAEKIDCRTNAGLEAGRVQGRVGGREKGLSSGYQKIVPTDCFFQLVNMLGVL